MIFLKISKGKHPFLLASCEQGGFELQTPWFEVDLTQVLSYRLGGVNSNFNISLKSLK
jgi:hypothetical protein